MDCIFCIIIGWPVVVAVAIFPTCRRKRRNNMYYTVILCLIMHFAWNSDGKINLSIYKLYIFTCYILFPSSLSYDACYIRALFDNEPALGSSLLHEYYNQAYMCFCKHFLRWFDRHQYMHSTRIVNQYPQLIILNFIQYYSNITNIKLTIINVSINQISGKSDHHF